MEVILFAPCIALLLAPIAGLVYLLYLFCIAIPLSAYRYRRLKEAYDIAKPLADAYYAKPEDERTHEETVALGNARAEYNKRVRQRLGWRAAKLSGYEKYDLLKDMFLYQYPGFYGYHE